MRLKIFRIAIAFLFLVIIGDLIYVQALKGPYYYNLSVNNRIRVMPLEGIRGRILDRNGKVLADNRLAYNVAVIPQAIKNKKVLFSFLSGVLEEPAEKLRKHFFAQKMTPFAPVVIAEDIPRDKAIILEENKFRFPSLSVQEGFQRVYPDGPNDAHILGYIGKINRSQIERYKEYGYSHQSLVGYSGVEEYYDPYLKGTEGGYQIEVNSRGNQVRLLSLKEPQNGQDISLTVDSRMQDIAEDVLSGARGAIIVMDASDGAIRTMVSSPTYDPNIFVQPDRDQDVQSVTRNPQAPLLNRATKGAFPPGSVFKIVGALAGLETGKLNPYQTYDCPGYLELGGLRFGCTFAHGTQNLTEALIHSCNVYFYHVGLLLGADTLYKYAHMLGLGEKTQIDLPYERRGHVSSKRNGLLARRAWYTGDTLNMVIGQGDTLTTPIQLVRMMATVVNEGKTVQPHLIQSLGGVRVPDSYHKQVVPIHAKNFKIVKTALRLVVTDYTGTAHGLDIPGLVIGGKTGTAQAGKGKEDHAWFVGYFEKGQKKYVFCVMLEHGGSSHHAVALGRELLTRFQEEQLI